MQDVLWYFEIQYTPIFHVIWKEAHIMGKLSKGNDSWVIIVELDIAMVDVFGCVLEVILTAYSKWQAPKNCATGNNGYILYEFLLSAFLPHLLLHLTSVIQSNCKVIICAGESC